MKFLLDQNISPKTTSYLRTLGHDAIDTRMLKLGEASDED
jgi:predicted nuclease of predicted toxin-antitoxin system